MAVVDSRIVEMKFENKLFEKNVNTSISTLERLKQALDFSKSTKSFDELEKSANKLDFSAIEKSLTQLNDRFSGFGVAGMTVISSLTNAALNLGSTLVNKVMSPITTGGWNRATNIDKAKFQLEGLNVAWKEIEEDINYGVADTAYGLDAAATAASQLVASGVKFGETFGETGNSPMAKALRGISGVAAMTNSSYEEIAHIFTTVAGQGKVMTMQLRQLEMRGLNAAAKLGEAMGKTEEEIREMVTKGEMDFATFSEKMDEAFGDHAKEANRTFEGALANMKSALGRIGAEFAAPYRQAMIPVFNKLREIFNDIKKVRLTPVFEIFNDFIDKASNFVTHILGDIDLSVFDGLASTLRIIYNEFDSFMSKWFPFWKSTEEELDEVEESATNTAEAITDMANRVLSGEFGTGEERKNAIEELGYAYELVQNKVNELLGIEFRYETESKVVDKATKQNTKSLDKLNKKLEESDENITSYTEKHKWDEFNSNMGDGVKGLGALAHIIGSFASAFTSSGASEALESIAFNASMIFSKVVKIAGDALVSLDDFLTKSGAYESFGNFVNGILSTVANVLETISGFADKLVSGDNPISNFFNSIMEGLDSQKAANLNDFLVTLIGNLNDIGITLTGHVINDAFNIIGQFLTGIARLAPKIIVALPMISAIGQIAEFIRGIGRTVSAFGKTLETVPKILQAYANDINATALIKLAGAILILSVAFTLLSRVSWDGLARGLLGLIAVIGALGVAMAGLYSLTSSSDALGLDLLKEKIQQTFQVLAARENSTNVLKLAVAIGILAASMWVLSNVSWEGLIKGAIAIGVLTGALLLLINAVQKSTSSFVVVNNPLTALSKAIMGIGTSVEKFLGAASTAMLLTSLAITIGAIAGVMAVLVRINWEDGLRALTFIGIILTELLVFINLLKNGDKIGNFATGVVMIAIGQLVKAMGSTVKKLSSVSWSDGLRGITFMGLILVEIMGIMKGLTAMNGDLNNLKLALFMFAIGSVLDSLASTVKKLSKIDFLDGMKAIGLMGLMLFELVTTVKALGAITPEGGTLKTLAFMVVLGFVADNLANVIKKLSKIPLGDGIKAVGLLGVLFFELTTALNSLSTELKGGQGVGGLFAMVGFGLAVKLMSGAIEKLADISAGGIAKAEIAIAGIMLIMTKLTKQLATIDTKSVLKGTLSLVPIIIALIAVVTAITALTGTDPAKLLAAGTAITMVMSSMVAFAFGMKKMAKVKFTSVLSSVLGFTLVLGAIAGILYLMRGMDADQMMAMSTAMSQMMAALGLLAIGSGVLAGFGLGGPLQSLVNALGTGALLIIFTAIVAGLGYLNDHSPWLRKALDSSIPMMQKIGEALGSLFGGFLTKAFLEPLSTSFEGMGQGLQSFIDNIMPFIDGTKDVPGDTTNLDNLKILLESIGSIAWESFVTKVKGWFSDKEGASQTFENLSTFIDNFVPFSDRLNELKPKKSIAKLGQIQTILETLAKINFRSYLTWVSQNFANGDITSSFTRVSEFAEKVSGLETALDPISSESTLADKIGVVRDVVKALGDVNWTSWLTNIVQSWTGSENMTTAMDYLVEFGGKVTEFSDSMVDVSEEKLTTAEKALGLITQFVAAVPGSSGWAQVFAGEKSLSDFSGELVTFGGDMEDFFKDVSQVNTEGADRIAKSIRRLNKVFTEIMSEGGLSDQSFLADRLHNLSETIGRIFEDISVDIGDEGAKVPLLEAGENMFNYLLEGFETAGEGYADDSRVGGSIDKLCEELLNALKGQESQDAMDAEAIKFVEGIVSAMEIATQDSQETLTTSITTMLKNAILDGIETSKTHLTNMDAAIRAKLNYIVKSIAGYKDSISGAIGTAFSGAESKLRTYISSFEKLGGDIMDGLIKGMNGKSTDTSTAASNAASGMLASAQKAVDSHSPAKKFIELGENMMEGLELGVRRYDSIPINAAAKVAGMMVNRTGDKIGEFGTMSDEAMGEVMATIIGAWNYITSMVEQDMTWQPVISPVLDLTNLQGGLGGMNSILSTGYHFGAAGIPDIYADRMNVNSTGDLYNQEAIVSQIRGLRSEIAALGEAMANMQLVMSTGQVVGAVTPGIDRQLGSIQKYNARWA